MATVGTRARSRPTGAAVLVITAAAILVGCSAPPGPIAATPAPMAPDATEGAAVENARPGEDTAWWRARFDPVHAIEVGTLGAGGVAVVQLIQQRVNPEILVFPMRSVLGPRDGLVVTIGGDDDRLEAVATVIDARSGEQRELLRTSDVVVDAVFATGTTVVFLTADSDTGAFTGTWQVDAAAPDRPEPVEGLLGEAADIQLVARRAASTQLVASPTGELVAAVHCTEEGACALRAVNLVEGTRYEQPLAMGDQLIGMGSERVFIQPMCMAQVCAGELLDLASGERAAIADAAGPLHFEKTVVASKDGPLLISQLSGDTMPIEGAVEKPSFVATDLGSVRTGAPVVMELESIRIVHTQTHDFGVELPRGWFAVMGAPPPGLGEGAGVAQGIFAVSASDGEAVPLPALGEFMVQG